MLMCQNCCKSLEYSTVIEENHKVDALNNITFLLKEGKHPHDEDTVRSQFMELIKCGHNVADATHQMKTTYNLYPPSPPAHDIITESN